MINNEEKKLIAASENEEASNNSRNNININNNSREQEALIDNMKRRYSSSVLIINSDQSNELSSYSRESITNNQRHKSKIQQDNRNDLVAKINSRDSQYDDDENDNVDDIDTDDEQDTEEDDETTEFNNNNNNHNHINKTNRELMFENNETTSHYSMSLLKYKNDTIGNNGYNSSKNFNIKAHDKTKDRNSLIVVNKSSKNISYKNSFQSSNNQNKIMKSNSSKQKNFNNSSTKNNYNSKFQDGQSSGRGDIHGIDRTTNRSATFNHNLADNDDSLSNTSEHKKKIIVRIVTVFSIIFFLMCFAMIAFTLRMSEKIDAEIREKYNSGDSSLLSTSTKYGLKNNQESLSQSLVSSHSTKKIHPMLISPPNDDVQNNNLNKVISKIKTNDLINNQQTQPTFQSTTLSSILFRAKPTSTI